MGAMNGIVRHVNHRIYYARQWNSVAIQCIDMRVRTLCMYVDIRVPNVSKLNITRSIHPGIAVKINGSH